MRPLLRPTWLQPTSLLPRLPRGLREIKTSTKLATTTDEKKTSKYDRARYEILKKKREHIKEVTSKALLTTPLPLPKIVITPGSKHHNSLPSYIEYAKRKNLEPTKSVFIGTHYEYVVALSLLRLGFSLIRTGRRDDLGIDLLGHWTLSQFSHQLPVILQCKSRSFGSVCAPRHVRELEGAFRGKPAGWKNVDVLGLLATTERATRGVLNALGASGKPMGFVKISRTGNIEQFVWNKAAAERGLEGVGVQLRYTPRALSRPFGSDFQGVEGEKWTAGVTRPITQKPKVSDSGAETDVQLTWMGLPIFPILEDLAPVTKELMAVVAPERRRPQAKKEAKEVKKVKKVKKAKPRVVRPKETNDAKPRIGRPKGSKDSYPRVCPSREATGRFKVADKVPRQTSKRVTPKPSTGLAARTRPKGNANIATPEALSDD
jgi:hypothetical protein